jgi:hypothetical protein
VTASGSRGAIVIDTDVFSADLVPGVTLVAACRGATSR